MASDDEWVYYFVHDSIGVSHVMRKKVRRRDADSK